MGGSDRISWLLLLGVLLLASCLPEAQADLAAPPEDRTELAMRQSGGRPPESGGPPRLVEFYADWCPTCQRLKPLVEELEGIYGRQVEFVYVNIDDPASQEMKQALGYRFQPHFFLIDAGGEILSAWIGYVTQDQLEAGIDRALLGDAIEGESGR